MIFINSALAFFFLFFIHGTSIENGQQGITHNVLWLGGRFNAAKPLLCVCADLFKIKPN